MTRANQLWGRVRAAFVLSTGRVGTMSLTALANLSRAVMAEHEPQPRFLAESRDAFASVAARQAGALAYLADRERRLECAARNNRLYLETSNRLTFFAPALAQLLPRAKFVHLHRHPLAVIRSGLARGWYIDHAEDPFRITPLKGERISWGSFSQGERIAWFWQAVNSLAVRFSTRIAARRQVRVSFDDLYGFRSVASAQALFAFLEVDPPATDDIRGLLAHPLNAHRSHRTQDGEIRSLDQFARVPLFEATAKILGYSRCDGTTNK